MYIYVTRRIEYAILIQHIKEVTNYYLRNLFDIMQQFA